MEWERDERQGRLALVGKTTGEDSNLAFRVLWKAFANEIVPLTVEAKWDCIRVYLWLDSGRVIVFPAHLTSGGLVDRAHCQIIVSDVFNEYERLAESDMPDDAFEARMAEIRSALISSLVQEAEAFNLAERVGVIPLRISFWKYDSEVIAEHELHEQS